MEHTNDSGKLFGNLALVLLVAGLLVPFIIAAFASEQLAMGFGVVAVILALVFGVLGWKHKPGKVSVIGVAIVLLWGLGTCVLYVRTKHDLNGQMDKVYQELVEETMTTENVEQRTERDSP